MKKTEKLSGYHGSFTLPGKSGNRVGVLLVHSLGGSPIELRFVAQTFARLGYTVHCPVIPGMADGTDIANMSEWRDWYAAVEKAHDVLRKDCDVVLVGGLSIGTMLAIRLAALRPEAIQGVMLFAPTFWPNGWAIPWTLNFFHLVRQRWFARMFSFTLKPPYGIKDDRIRRFVIESSAAEGRSVDDLFARSGTVVLELRRLAAETKRRIGDVRQPTAIFHPRHDDQSHISTVAKLQQRLGGVVETLILDDSYHRVTLDRQRMLVVDRASDFADRLVQKLEQDAKLARIISDNAAGAGTAGRAKPQSVTRAAD